ncbi:ABC transporter ATP-binding protein [soil metagenome]
MSLLKVQNVSKKGDKTHIVSDVSFEQQPQQKIALAGETGSGKTTLLKMIAGLIQPDEGDIFFEGKRIPGPEEKLVPGHKSIAYLSQQYDLAKFLRVEQVLAYANSLAADDAQLLYEVCQITEFMNRRTDELSGGEKQRVALAKALVGSPQLLLLDEPFSNLDITHKNILKLVIDDICGQLQISCILVSHDPLDTLPWADEILIMKEGKIIQQGAAKAIYRKPVDEYAAGLFGKYNLFSVDATKVLVEKLGVKTESKKFMARPEDIKLVPCEDSMPIGIVKAISFYGSYYETEVSILESVITVRTGESEVEVGDEVGIVISNL